MKTSIIGLLCVAIISGCVTPQVNVNVEESHFTPRDLKTFQPVTEDVKYNIYVNQTSREQINVSIGINLKARKLAIATFTNQMLRMRCFDIDGFDAPFWVNISYVFNSGNGVLTREIDNSIYVYPELFSNDEMDFDDIRFRNNTLYRCRFGKSDMNFQKAVYYDGILVENISIPLEPLRSCTVDLFFEGLRGLNREDIIKVFSGDYKCKDIFEQERFRLHVYVQDAMLSLLK